MSEPRAERPAMDDYGVNTPAWAPLPWSWAAERLVANKNFWVVTVSAAGRPHALPVWGVWDDENHRFAFSCSPNSRKARNLAANPQAVVTVDDTIECVSVEGRAGVLHDESRKDRYVGMYLQKYVPYYAELSEEFVRRSLMIEFTPDRAFAIIERDEEFATRATRWVFGM